MISIRLPVCLRLILCGGSIVAILGLTRIVEAQEPSEEDNCKPVGENSINLTSTAKIRHDEHALIDGPWCDRTSPWRVRYSNAKEGLDTLSKFDERKIKSPLDMKNVSLWDWGWKEGSDGITMIFSYDSDEEGQWYISPFIFGYAVL